MADETTPPAEGSPEGAPADPGTEGGAGEPEAFVLPENFADTVKGWELDDLAKADEYVQLGKALQTEEGVIDGFIGLGQRLGLGVKDLERLFAEEEVTPPPAPAPGEESGGDPDRLLTYAETMELLKSQVIEPQRQAQEAQQAAFEEHRKREAFAHIDNWFDTHEVPAAKRRIIASHGEQLFEKGADPFDPKAIDAALERGKAQYDAEIEADVQTYIAAKVAAGEKLPVHLGGGSPPGGEPEEKPDYVEAGQKQNAMALAKQRVRDRLKAAGELE